MKASYDFSKGKQGAIVPMPQRKEKIMIHLDTEVLEWFRTAVDDAGGGSYQTLINNVLRDHIEAFRNARLKEADHLR